jgi:hypothetical protein
MNAIKRSTPDSIAFNTKSEDPFLPYQGKGIRHISIKRYGFEKDFADTSQQINYSGTKLLNLFHTDSREWVIRDNLFISEKTPLDAYEIADNERYLRSLEFIHDARILVTVIPDEPDSVDLIVVTKDLFSILGTINDLNPTAFKINTSEVNLAGMGQKISVTTLWDKAREPGYGYQFLYSKTNIAGTFINGSASYATINPDIFNGSSDERAWYIKLDQPLVSQYSHFAGDITVGQNESFNTYSVPDTAFFKYSFNTFDAWMGYNFGADKTLYNNSKSERNFVSLRYFQNHFSQLPMQIGNQLNFRFNDKEALLAQFVFFKQSYYKTNYIYGFGTTEDVPHGYNIALTTGWYKQSYLSRPYAGVEANRYIGSSKGDFIQYFLRSGAFLKDGQIQDASFLVGTSMLSRLYLYKGLKIRQYFRFSYTRQFNRVGQDALRIDNPFGLLNFSSDSTIGYQRISLNSETSFFLKYKLFGFKFAPFLFGAASFLSPEQGFIKSGIYYGLGGGVRTRNENIVFGTIEMRFNYFPNKVAQNTPYKITISTNLLFKYNTNYVNAPDIVQLNSDPNNNVY